MNDTNENKNLENGEKKSLKARINEFGEKHPKLVKTVKIVGTVVGVAAVAVIGSVFIGNRASSDCIEEDLLDGSVNSEVTSE